MKYRAIKGTKDILPPETCSWQYIESVVRQTMGCFGYREIRTPIFERTALFARSIGELTDIVSKEMYTFLDRSEESLTLRPEGTASTLRAYIQHSLGEQMPLAKLYYIGPMFRQERPQAGRLRQFHQFGAEALGSPSPQLDVEMMLLPLQIYQSLGIKTFSLTINSVGCPRCRPKYKELLRSELRKVFDQLSEDSQRRVEQNPLRVLDSKDENDRTLTATIPSILDYLCEECSTHFETVQKVLDTLRLPYTVDNRLVRGLDYYTKTAFEITSTSLGSQDALAGGGRYDMLVEELGGAPTPGVGFAAGMERLLTALTASEQFQPPVPTPDLFIVALDAESRSFAFQKAMELRNKGFAVEMDYNDRSVKAQMREANRQQAHYVIVVGSNELASGKGVLKEMSTGKEIPVSLDNLQLPQ
ncbi:MAG: histidine--tRNA ligase [Bacteroidetes bacterium]|nr:histidine--tRNA ligase [Bacteroidota bacterium]HOV98841.1 histidine--tRNA ligase [Bacteroidota bacterium]